MEPARRRRRPTRVRTTSLVSLALVGALASGCGSEAADPEPVATAPATACATARDDSVVVVRADLDGDGSQEEVRYLPATAQCAPALATTVRGDQQSAALDEDLPVRPGGSFAIAVPGRIGQIAVVPQEHPRGGFQVVLLGWSAGGGASTIDVADRPVFPFVATDVEPSPITARCVPGGVELDQARRHEPVGVVPAWDVERTRYTVNGTSATAGPAEEIADNVLEKDLRATYGDLVNHVLFSNCRVG